MKLTIEYDEKTLIDDVMANMPEYSQSYLRCIGWNYVGCEYHFEEEVNDADNPIVRMVTRPKLNKGLKLMLKLIQNRKLNVGLDLSNFTDAGQWDAIATDALVQCAIFGEVIYG